MRKLAATIVAGMVVLGVSCVGEVPENQNQPDIEIDLPDDVEVIYIYGQGPYTTFEPADSVNLSPRAPTLYPVPDEGRTQLPVGHAPEAIYPDDPCECIGDGCLEGWADQNLGCNVCAVFVCGQMTTEHICHFCAMQ
jgi:hypothetical protein